MLESKIRLQRVNFSLLYGTGKVFKNHAEVRKRTGFKLNYICSSEWL
jgi:hypothetical protein